MLILCKIVVIVIVNVNPIILYLLVVGFVDLILLCSATWYCCWFTVIGTQTVFNKTLQAQTPSYSKQASGNISHMLMCSSSHLSASQLC